MEKLLKYIDLLNISEIERQIGCPRTTLQKAVKYKHRLPKKWESKLNEYMNNFLKT